MSGAPAAPPVPAPTWRGEDLELDLVDAGSLRLVRLFRHAGTHWDPPAPQYRDLRVDPPAGHKSAFAVLYTADAIEAVATECRVLRFNESSDEVTCDLGRAESYQVARYSFSRPALFIPIDGPNRKTLGVQQLAFEGYHGHQVLALQLFQRYGEMAHGLSWESYHRGQPGRVYAVWHSRKDAMGLQVDTAASMHRLVDDVEWKAFLAAHPRIALLDPTPPVDPASGGATAAPPGAAAPAAAMVPPAATDPV